MHKGLLSSAVLVGIFSTPGFAADLSYPSAPPPSDSPVYNPAPMVTGHLEGGIGYLDWFSTSYGVAQAFGRANVPLFGGGWNFEAEIGGVAVFDDGDVFTNFEGVGHLWARMPAAAAGVFGGASAFFEEGVGTVGVEGEAYFGQVTLGAQASYNWADFDDFFGLRGYADWYINPDLRLGGDVQYWDIDSADLWQVSGEVEKRFTGTPVSLGGTLTYFNVDGDDAWSGLINARIFMDPAGTTLQQHDRDVPFDFVLPTFD